MQDLEAYLMSEVKKDVSAADLRAYGRKAAQDYVSSGTPLNDSIKSIVKTASLNPEQTRRVVEHANPITFSFLFKQGFDKNVSFPVADADVILGGCVKTASVNTSRRLGRQTRYVPGQENVTDDDFFGGVSKEKTASAQRSMTQLSWDYRAMDREFSEQKGRLGVLHGEFETSLEKLAHLIKRASPQNTPQLLGAAIEHGTSNKLLLEVIRERVGDSATVGSLEKIAQMGWEPVPGNPVTGLVQDLDQIAQKLLAANGAVERTRQGMTELLSVLQGAAPMPGPGAPPPAPVMGAAPPEAGMPPGAPPEAGMPPAAAAPPGAGAPPAGAAA